MHKPFAKVGMHQHATSIHTSSLSLHSLQARRCTNTTHPYSTLTAGKAMHIDDSEVAFERLMNRRDAIKWHLDRDKENKHLITSQLEVPNTHVHA